MAVQDRYYILSSVMRIANTGRLPYQARLKSLAKFLSKTFRFDSTVIYTLDDEGRRLSQKIASFGPDHYQPCSIPLGEGVAGLCAARRTVLQNGREGLHGDESLKGSEQRVVAVPILDAGALLGIVSFGLREELTPPASEMQLLQDVLIEIAGLIRSARIAEGSNRRVRNLTILGELGAVLNQSLPPETLLPRILQTCHKSSGASCAVVRLLNGRGLPGGVYKKSGQKGRRFLSPLLEIEEECSTRVLETGLPLLVTDMIADLELPPSHICVPLRFESTVLGTLTVFGKREHAGGFRNFDAEDRELLENMAMLISNALEGAANHQRILLLAAENDKKLKELSLLYRLSNTMLSTIKLNKLIHLTLTALTSGANPFFERAMLLLVNERAGVIQGMLGVTRETAEGVIPPLQGPEELLFNQWDISEVDMARQRDSAFSRQVRAMRLKLNKRLNVTSKAVLEKRLIYVPDSAKEKVCDREIMERFGITSFASAPLMAKEQVVGAVIVDNPYSGKVISRDDLHFLQLLTNQAGMAIENSMLYNRLEDVNRSLREAQEKLVQGEKLVAVGEMAACIAHELKGPLVSIGGFAKRLEKKTVPGTTESKYAGIIGRESERLEKLLTDILIFSKKGTLCYAECDVAGMLDEVLAIIAGGTDERGIRVVRRLPPEGVSLLGDCQQLKQVFLNLFSNAQQAMENGGELSIGVTRARLGGKDAISIKVSDTGGGMPLEMLNRIFTPFFTTKESGTGLGLSIAHTIVANHGGKIQVRNKEGVGMDFTVLLPLRP